MNMAKTKKPPAAPVVPPGVTVHKTEHNGRTYEYAELRMSPYDDYKKWVLGYAGVPLKIELRHKNPWEGKLTDSYWIASSYWEYNPAHYDLETSSDSCAFDVLNCYPPGIDDEYGGPRGGWPPEFLAAVAPSTDELDRAMKEMKRVTTAHVIEREKALLPLLEAKGFEIIAETKSKHDGHYKVWMLLWDPAKNKKTKKAKTTDGKTKGTAG